MTNNSFGNLPIGAKLNLVLSSSPSRSYSVPPASYSASGSARSSNRSLAELQPTNRQVVDMIDAYASVLERSAEVLGAQFASGLPRRLSLDAGRSFRT